MLLLLPPSWSAPSQTWCRAAAYVSFVWGLVSNCYCRCGPANLGSAQQHTNALYGAYQPITLAPDARCSRMRCSADTSSVHHAAPHKADTKTSYHKKLNHYMNLFFTRMIDYRQLLKTYIKICSVYLHAISDYRHGYISNSRCSASKLRNGKLLTVLSP